MRSSLLAALILFSSQILAQVDRKLPNGKWAYYGEEFHSKFPKIHKDLLTNVLNSSHNSSPGKPDTISSSCITDCYKHTSVGYDGARKILFGELFVKKDSDGTYVEDVYCGKKFHFRHVNDVSNMHTQVNIEHTWPQSKFSSNYDKNMQKSDMHHLYPTDSDANNRRANHTFGEDPRSRDELNVQNCSISQLIRLSDHFIFTPPNSHRGNVARSLFYFAVRYRLFIHPAEEVILRQWHKIDPVDQSEKDRHEVIAKYQKVRNPFVDYPELVEKVADF